MGKPGRQLGHEGGRACLCFPSSWSGAPPSLSVTLSSSSKACLWSGDLLGSPWVGREVGLKILRFNSDPAQPTDCKRILAFEPSGSPP